MRGYRRSHMPVTGLLSVSRVVLCCIRAKMIKDERARLEEFWKEKKKGGCCKPKSYSDAEQAKEVDKGMKDFEANLPEVEELKLPNVKYPGSLSEVEALSKVTTGFVFEEKHLHDKRFGIPKTKYNSPTIVPIQFYTGCLAGGIKCKIGEKVLDLDFNASRGLIHSMVEGTPLVLSDTDTHQQIKSHCINDRSASWNNSDVFVYTEMLDEYVPHLHVTRTSSPLALALALSLALALALHSPSPLTP